MGWDVMGLGGMERAVVMLTLDMSLESTTEMAKTKCMIFIL